MDFMSMTSFFTKERRRYIAVFFLSCVYFLAYRNYGVNYWDEGVPLSGALRILEGERAGKDFVAYLPLRYFMFAAAMKLSGGTVAGPRILMAVIAGIVSLLIYSVSNRFLSPYQAFFPVGLYWLTPSPYYYRFFTLLMMMTLWIILRLLRQPALTERIFLGIAAGFAVWCRQEFGDFLIILMGLTAVSIHRRQQALRVWEGFEPLALAVIAWLSKILYWGNSWDLLKYYKDVFISFRSSKPQMSLPWPRILDPSLWQDSGFWYGFERLSIYIGAAVILTGFYIGIRHFRREYDWWVLWLVCAFGFGLVIWRPGIGNFHRSLPPISIMGLCFFFKFKPSAWVRFALQWIVMGLFALLLADSLFVNPSIYHSIGIRGVFATPVKHSKLPVWGSRYEATMLDQVDDALQTALTLEKLPGHGLMCLPFNSIWNYTTGVLNPTYYEWLLPGMIPRDSHQTVLADIQRGNPKIILLGLMPWDGVESRRFSKQYPELFNWFERHYFRWMMVDDFVIYLQPPLDTVHLLSEASLHHVKEVFGNNEIKSELIINEQYPVLNQKGQSVFTIEIELSGMQVFKTKVMCAESGLEQNNEAIFLSVRLSTSDESVFLINGGCQDIGLQGEELLIDLRNWNSSRAYMEFECAGTDKRGIKWIDPIVFNWPTP